ncbi:hypothetical protein BB561_004553 [Smittium simulii]|uniref:RRM domain-containing protein n=1 Tax=Smittium simulii TaxID=133385 RepID=A0A2T9YFR7_9FUNG|nr:hypothetical protein BB561_004553 [Smittium simulii]
MRSSSLLNRNSLLLLSKSCLECYPAYFFKKTYPRLSSFSTFSFCFKDIEVSKNLTSTPALDASEREILKNIQIKLLPATTTPEDIYKLSDNSSQIKKIDFLYNSNLKFKGTCFVYFDTVAHAQNFFYSAHKTALSKKFLQINYTFNTAKDEFFDDKKYFKFSKKTVAVYGFPKIATAQNLIDRFDGFEFVSAVSSPIVEFLHTGNQTSNTLKKYFLFYFATESEAHRFVRSINMKNFYYHKNDYPDTLNAWILY